MGKERKCCWCKMYGNHETMVYEEQKTGKFNKNGTEKILKKYFHLECHKQFIKDKKFKEAENNKWSSLYEFVKSIHNLNVLDGRMIEQLQDLRNGTIKLPNSNKKIKKYKNGVGYDIILKAYQESIDEINYWKKAKQFDKKYGEFAYCLSIVKSKINDVFENEKIIKKQEETFNKTIDNVIFYQEINIQNKTNKKKDELDISDFL